AKDWMIVCHPGRSLVKVLTHWASERARSSLSLATSIPINKAEDAGDEEAVMACTLPCRCERGGVASSGGCSGEATRDRLGPCLVTAVAGRGPIGRGSVVVFA